MYQNGEKFYECLKCFTIQNDLILNGSRVFIPTTSRKVIETYHDIHQGTNVLKILLKKNAWWLFMDNDIKHFVKIVPIATKIDQD